MREIRLLKPLLVCPLAAKQPLNETTVSCNGWFMPSRREELLERLLEHFLEHGVADATLRPVAERVGSSARLLVYHFGSKEELLAAVVGEVRSRLQTFFAVAFQSAPARGGKVALRSFWDQALRPKNLRLFRLLFEVQILALQNPGRYGPLLDGNSESWLSLISQVLPPSRVRGQRAALCAAVLDGLLLEVLSGGSRALATAALDEFLRLVARSWLEGSPSSPSRSPLGSSRRQRQR